jgi:hypothetical protein
MAQHDYDITNQAGSLFRADLNNVLSAIQTNNLGTSDPDTLYTRVGGMWWLDTTDSWLKLRNSTNTQWIKVLRYSNGAPILSPVQSKAGTYTVLETELGNIFRCTAALTLNLPAVSGLYDGWWIGVRNESGGSVTLDGNASEQINGATTFVLQSGVDALVYCNASAFYTIDSSHSNTCNTATALASTLGIGAGGTGQTSKTPAFDALAPCTNKGDLIAYNGSDNVRVAAGTNGYILSANTGASAGVNWIANAPSAGTVTQSKLSTTQTNAYTDISGFGTAAIALTGGTYSWWTANTSYGGSGDSSPTFEIGDVTSTDGYGYMRMYKTDSGTGRIHFYERYVAASPPYDFGDGNVYGFLYLRVDSNGNITGFSIAEDPVWQAHSKIDIKKPTFIQRQIGGMPIEVALQNPATLNAYMQGNVSGVDVELPVTAQVKNDVMSKWPAPFTKQVMKERSSPSDPREYEDHTLLLLDPLSDITANMIELLRDEQTEVQNEIINGGRLQFGNSQMPNRAVLPEVLTVDVNWVNNP